MVLAAGVGSRLRPLTDSTPKALVDVGGRPLIELVIRRLKRAGVDSVVVNAFHLADKLEAFLKGADLGVRVTVSREDVLLDTGGGLKNAARFLQGGEPFFLHNVDVVTAIDLGALYAAHRASGALATLAVRRRPSSRQLLFDAAGRLRGREADGRLQWAGEPAPQAERLAYDGVQVVSPALLPRLTEDGVFPILSAYLRLASEGADLRAFRSDAWAWADVGSPEKLEAARRLAASDRLI